jgi:hypothetical protein
MLTKPFFLCGVSHTASGPKEEKQGERAPSPTQPPTMADPFAAKNNSQVRSTSSCLALYVVRGRGASEAVLPCHAQSRPLLAGTCLPYY